MGARPKGFQVNAEPAMAKNRQEQKVTLESALQMLLRGEDAENFVLTLTCRNGICTISFSDLDVPEILVSGAGVTFDEAWQRRGPQLDVQRV